MIPFLSDSEKVAIAMSIGIPQKMTRLALKPVDILAYGDAVVETTLHKVMAGYDYHRDGAQPGDDQVFVFGSNLAGIHGAGAARAAMDQYGAIIGQGIGLVGRSYALPTKDQRIETLPIDVVERYVAEFKQFAIANPDKKFFITRVGCGLAGFTDSQIAPMFRGCPTNCDMPTNWGEWLEPDGVARALVQLFASKTERSMSTDWQEAVAVELIRLTTALGVLRNDHDTLTTALHEAAKDAK